VRPVVVLEKRDLSGTAADTDITERAKRLAVVDETDDSCPMHPLDGAADDRCTPEITGPVAEDNQELLEDVKIEDARESDTEYQNLSIKAEVSSNVETAANDVQFPLEVTGGDMRPVVVLEKLDLSQHTKQLDQLNIQSATGSAVEMNTEADSNDITQHPRDDKPRPYACTVCDKRFTLKDSLNRHRTLHTGENSYSCTRCKKRFHSQSYLRRHMNVHSSKYKCSECGKCFQGNKDLTRHKLSHSGARPFECSVCGKRFTQSADLAVHSRIHSGEKPYKCHVCDKAFSRSEYLPCHMRVHTEERPYKCSLCNKCFSQSSILLRHFTLYFYHLLVII